MPIAVNLDLLLVKRKMKLKDLADKIGITTTNLSILKTGKAKAIRFSTLEGICRELSCQPGDILKFVDSEDGNEKEALKGFQNLTEE
jgi:putative transcriptional regulator